MSEQSSKYDRDWMALLLAHCLRDSNVLRVVQPRMKLDDFQLALHQVIWRALGNYYAQFRNVPTTRVLLREIGKLVASGYAGEESIPALSQLLPELYSISLDAVWFLQEFESFIKTVRVGAVIGRGHEYIQEGEFDKLYGDLREAYTASHVDHSPVVSPFAEFLSIDMEAVVPTMIADIDAAMDGGLCPKETGMVMAITGGGKTIFLENILFGASIHKFNALYATFELGREKLAQRLYSCATGIPYKEIKRAPVALQQRIVEMTKRFEPYVRIKEFLDAPYSLLDVENTIHQLADDGWETQLLITDWLDCVQSIKYGNDVGRVDERHVLQAVAVEHTVLANRLGIPVWTATQANRSAIGRNIIDLRHTAEAYSKAWKLDVVWTIQEDSEEQGVYNCYSAKLRDNPKKLIKLRGDLDRMRFRPLT